MNGMSGQGASGASACLTACYGVSDHQAKHPVPEIEDSLQSFEDRCNMAILRGMNWHNIKNSICVARRRVVLGHERIEPIR